MSRRGICADVKACLRAAEKAYEAGDFEEAEIQMRGAASACRGVEHRMVRCRQIAAMVEASG